MKKTMKTLKIISVISFLLISGIQLRGTLNIGMIFLYFYTFFNCILNNAFFIESSWESVLFIPILGTVFILFSLRPFKDKYLLLLCYIALTLFSLLATGALDCENYSRISYGFIIPSTIFIISSIILIVLNFRKPTKKDNLEK